MENKDEIGKALGKIPSGVGILTARHGDQESALLASWFQQASFEPPMILVAVNKKRPLVTLLETSKKFALSLLHTNQKDILGHFGKGFEPGVNPFQGVDVIRRETGSPILSQAMSYLECELVGSLDAADHHIYMGRVIAGGILNDGTSMVHLRKNGFHY